VDDVNGVSGVVLVTGGTGSLGQALLTRSEADRWDASFIVYSRDEAKQAALRERFPSASYVLGDVRDVDGLAHAMRGADVVIHAAAYKRVPEAERQTITCADANVNGSANVVSVARRLGTPRVVGLSTDKACQPINAYGASKLLMERMFQAEALERPAGPRFTLTRYGNVLTSTGSVVPAFRSQSAAGGPLRLTDPHMTRFWLTLDDAVDLVVAALRLPSGSILIPRCLASSMAVMAEAIAPGVPTVFGGNRGGEKANESLLNGFEAPYAQETSQGFILSPMVGAPVAALPEGFTYRSDGAPQFTAKELRHVIDSMDGSTPIRTLAG
jgi:UDP-N-acetylglucosamine 4,6-dehydratase